MMDKTEELLEQLHEQANNMVNVQRGDPYTLLESLGITDHDFFRKWIDNEASLIVETGLLTRERPEIDYLDAISVGIISGIIMGYQLALMRESNAT